jgi:hypothetical protein
VRRWHSLDGNVAARAAGGIARTTGLIAKYPCHTTGMTVGSRRAFRVAAERHETRSPESILSEGGPEDWGLRARAMQR